MELNTFIKIFIDHNETEPYSFVIAFLLSYQVASIKGKINREAILAVGAEVFCESGFNETAMSDIATRLSGTKAAIYRYFASKEELYIELIKRSTYSQGPAMMDLIRNSGGNFQGTSVLTQVDFPDITDPSYSLKETLMSFGEYLVNAFHTPQSLAIQRMVIAATINSDAGYTFYEQGQAKAIDSLRKFFAIHIEAGILRKADARVAACHYYGLLQSEIYQVGIFNVVTSIQPSITKVIVARAVEIFLKGYEQVSPTFKD